jgi:hypothetical protein
MSSKWTEHQVSFSDPRTPQRNGKVEQKFQTLYGRMRATLNNGGLEDSVRTGVWAECARITTFLSSITLIKAKGKCPYQLMFGSKLKLLTSLNIPEEIVIVTTKDDIQGKSKNRCLTNILILIHDAFALRF